MKLLRGRAEMRWMPSRRHFALFRLIAYLRLRGVSVEGEPDRVLSIDRHQSAVEMYGVASWCVLTLTCYIGAALSEAGVPLIAGLAIGLPLAGIVLQALAVATGLVVAPFVRLVTGTKGANNIRINSAFVMLLLVLLATAFAAHRTWVRFAAWQFLAAVALNGVAATIVFFLAGEINRLETALGGLPSDSSSLRSH